MIQIMATNKKRINISLSKELEEALTILAKNDNVPIATEAVKLIELALEIEEDRILDEIASKRDTKDAEYISHEKTWKDIIK
jgi:predicted DNA-binding protein